MSKLFFCCKCGELYKTREIFEIRCNGICVRCKEGTELIESKFDEEYYKKQSMLKYGNDRHDWEFMYYELRDLGVIDIGKLKQTFFRMHCYEDEFVDFQYENRLNGDDINNYYYKPDDIYSSLKPKYEEGHVPKCPTCGSENVKKISTLSKIAGGAMFGLLSKTAKSQYQCNNCGYKW